MTSVFIDGAAGTTGIEIADRLAQRTDISLISLSDAQRKSDASRRDALNAADIAILCLPDEAARAAVAMIANPTTRVIDASTAHRTAAGWCYGFPELGHDVRGALRVSNPGCYPTGFLALVAPLVAGGLVPADWPICVNAVSGYSGGGKAMIAEFESGSAPPAWRTYALTLAHKHVPEMQQHAGLQNPPVFAPSVANTYRGMIVDVPLSLSALPKRPHAMAIADHLEEYFAASPLVSVTRGSTADAITIAHAADTDRLDLFILANERGDQVRLIAALDNLGKGASGACVQSLNLLAGCEETTGVKL